MIGPDPANWVPDRPGIDHNVAIVGGGQSGCALAFALRRAGIGKVTILEAAPNEDRAGIWLKKKRDSSGEWPFGRKVPPDTDEITSCEEIRHAIVTNSAQSTIFTGSKRFTKATTSAYAA